MPASKANQRAVNKYVKNNYDRIEVKVKKGQKALIQAHADKHSESLNAFVVRAIDETIKRDDDDAGTDFIFSYGDKKF